MQIVQTESQPLKIEFTFYRRTRGRFDFLNMAQVLLDIMQDCEYIADDSTDYVIPFFRPPKYVREMEDDLEPGVVITVLKVDI